MSFDADVTACAALVERADAMRFRSVMSAPVEVRKILFPLFAFNVEVARAPWVTQEPMIAEMRLQWWRDVCEEIAQARPVRRHEVATPLAAAITVQDAELLDTAAAARRWDIYKDPFEDEAHFARYIDQTAGNLAWVAARRLGDATEDVVRDAAFGAGVAAWLIAIPELEAQGRVPLIDGTAQGVVALAQEALGRLRSARGQQRQVSRAARPAVWHVASAEQVLKAAINDPVLVGQGQLPDPLENGRSRFALRALMGRW
ncbi:MAG: squalene/phytoene synthase family protein [Sulfitobacter sp.]